MINLEIKRWTDKLSAINASGSKHDLYEAVEAFVTEWNASDEAIVHKAKKELDHWLSWAKEINRSSDPNRDFLVRQAVIEIRYYQQILGLPPTQSIN